MSALSGLSRRAKALEKRIGESMITVRKEALAKEEVDVWFAQWEELQREIHAAHDKRDGTAQPLMEKGIALFEQFLLDVSDTTEQLDLQQTYEVLPINGAERLQFIKMRPGQYACYRQLDELYKETKKRCARLRLTSSR